MSALQASEHTSMAACAAVVLQLLTQCCVQRRCGTHSSGFPATYETATSFARFRRCCTHSIPCYAPYGPGQHIMYCWSMLLLLFKSMGLLIRQAPTWKIWQQNERTLSDADLILRMKKFQVQPSLLHLYMPNQATTASCRSYETDQRYLLCAEFWTWLALQVKQSLRPFWAGLTQTLVSMRPLSLCGLAAAPGACSRPIHFGQLL